MRKCATCKHALVLHGRQTRVLPNGDTVIQNGGTGYFCQRPGGAGNVTLNMNTGAMDCSGYEEVNDNDSTRAAADGDCC